VVAVLFRAGAQVPVILFIDVVGSGESIVPEQTGATAANVGVTIGLTIIVNVVVVAHCPAVGVNVYVVVVVLFRAGAHVPVIELLDVVGNADSGAPEQIAGTALKAGVMLGVTVMIRVVVVAH
jgi:hypothetical protein